MQSAVAQCGIRTVITSKVFLEKAKIDALDGAVFLEDILAKAGGFDKLRAAVRGAVACRPDCWPRAAARPIRSRR